MFTGKWGKIYKFNVHPLLALLFQFLAISLTLSIRFMFNIRDIKKEHGKPINKKFYFWMHPKNKT